MVYQDLVEVPCIEGAYPVLGIYMVGGQAMGMGIREDREPVTGNGSRFVPHILVPAGRVRSGK